MEVLQIKKKALNAWVDSLIRGDREVVGVVRKENRFVYAPLASAADLTPDYDETILPPKKYFLPVKETLLSYTSGDPASCEAICDSRPRVIFGMHPGDCAAVALLDKTMQEVNTDPQYKARRDNTVIVGLHPMTPYAHRFTSPVVAMAGYQAADLMLTGLVDGSFAVEVVTEKGRALLPKKGAVKAAEPVMKAMEKAKGAVKNKLALNKDPRTLPAFLNNREKDPVFDERAKRCFSCGSCVMVCPTCYCFDVVDEVELSLKKGVRTRTWDGCMLQGFAQVTGGHNFRKKPEDRFRHRIFRKAKYLVEKFGLPGCVGCGRCGHACTAGIASPVEVLNEMA